MAFRYVAISPDGEQIRGALDVPSESQAERALWDANYRVVSIRQERKLPGIEQIFPTLYSVKKRALITFSRQLATLLESGVPVMRSLELLEEQTTSKPLVAAIRGISKSVRGGSTFASAIEEFPAVRDAVSRAEEALRARGRVFLRYSGTEPLLRILVEGADAAEVNSIANELEAAVRAELA